jgi:hypothetical protein
MYNIIVHIGGSVLIEMKTDWGQLLLDAVQFYLVPGCCHHLSIPQGS